MNIRCSKCGRVAIKLAKGSSVIKGGVVCYCRSCFNKSGGVIDSNTPASGQYAGAGNSGSVPDFMKDIFNGGFK